MDISIKKKYNIFFNNFINYITLTIHHIINYINIKVIVDIFRYYLVNINFVKIIKTKNVK